MGRKADSPEVQAAKGNTNRRKAQTQARASRAKSIADMIASGFEQSVSETAPALIKNDPIAVQMWADLAPVLSKTFRLQPQHKALFYSFCFYYAEFAIAHDMLAKQGLTQAIPTVADPSVKMTRLNPMKRVRDEAHAKCLELSRRFGLTPQDEYSLFKDQQVAMSANPWLFGQQAPAQGEVAEVKADQESSHVGILSSLDSPPPGAKIN